MSLAMISEVMSNGGFAKTLYASVGSDSKRKSPHRTSTLARLAKRVRSPSQSGPSISFAMTARQRLHRLVGELDPHQQRRLAPLAWLYPHGPLWALAAAADPNRKAREHALANLVRGHLRADAADAEAAKAVTLLLERLTRVRLVPQSRHPALYDIVYDDGLFDDGGMLSDPKVLDVVVPAIEELARQDWQTAGALRSVMANWLARRPAGEGLPGLAER